VRCPSAGVGSDYIIITTTTTTTTTIIIIISIIIIIHVTCFPCYVLVTTARRVLGFQMEETASRCGRGGPLAWGMGERLTTLRRKIQLVTKCYTGPWTLRGSLERPRQRKIHMKQALGPTQPYSQWVQRALSLGLKRPRREADHSPSSSAEVKECVELSSTPPIRLQGVMLS
jgi:hypothetical protein